MKKYFTTIVTKMRDATIIKEDDGSPDKMVGQYEVFFCDSK